MRAQIALEMADLVGIAGGAGAMGQAGLARSGGDGLHQRGLVAGEEMIEVHGLASGLA